jgi:16S rRNA (cytidine1402-2'-O)-methyltransferase
VEKGKLYIVSTPIGNLGDITLRAIEILKTSDIVVAEDTREAGKLIQLLELPKKSYFSYRDQNHEYALPIIKAYLDEGKIVALISDRGTPLISDPGYKLIRDLIDEGYSVETVPGPSSVIAALTISGLPTDRFTFLGFLPRSSGKQKKVLEQFQSIPTTLIIFESPFRLIKTLTILEKIYGDVEVAAVNELTKLHEKVFRGKLSAVLKTMQTHKSKGEWVIVVRTQE